MISATDVMATGCQHCTSSLKYVQYFRVHVDSRDAEITSNMFIVSRETESNRVYGKCGPTSKKLTGKNYAMMQRLQVISILFFYL